MFLKTGVGMQHQFPVLVILPHQFCYPQELHLLLLGDPFVPAQVVVDNCQGLPLIASIRHQI